jgi:hypothetical protein
MPGTLEDFGDFLQQRGDPCPLGPEPEPFERVKPQSPRFDGFKAVIGAGFGTSMLLSGGEPQLFNADPVMKKIALEKTIHEFKMWQSMSRKPGNPSDYMEVIVRRAHEALLLREFAGPDVYPTIHRVWRGVIDTLIKNEYAWDAGFHGDADSLSRRVTLFYLRASQGLTAMPGLLKTLTGLGELGILRGLHADAQCDAPARLAGELKEQGRCRGLFEVLDPAVTLWSFETGIRSTSERGWALLEKALAERGIAPGRCLYVAHDAEGRIGPAKRRGFKTALLMADRVTARVSKEHLTDPKTRPDALVTAWSQVLDIARASC